MENLGVDGLFSGLECYKKTRCAINQVLYVVAQYFINTNSQRYKRHIYV